MTRLFAIAALCLLSGVMSAQATTPPEPPTQGGSPMASAVPIATAGWLVGCWEGEGLGGRLQECWSSANDGQMSGHFTLAVDGKPRFHEFMVLEEHEGGLRLRVKHFNRDMTGWEEKDRSVDFQFVSADEDTLTFSALTIQKEGRNRMVMHLRIRGAGGAVTMNELTFRRVRR